MTEQIEFNMDAEYSLRVAAHPELVEIDPYEKLESEFCLDEDDMPDPDAATVEAWAEETRIVMLEDENRKD
jgi:hypothetical protein